MNNGRQLGGKTREKEKVHVAFMDLEKALMIVLKGSVVTGTENV